MPRSNKPQSTFSLLLVTWLVSIALNIAHADEISFSAAFSCDAAKSKFWILANVIADSPHAGVPRVHPSSELVTLETGKRVLSCQLGQATVTAQIHVWPAGQGECQGAGRAELDWVAVNNKAIVNRTALNQSCWAKTTVVALELRSIADGILVSFYDSPGWTWDKGYGELTVRRERHAVDRMK